MSGTIHTPGPHPPEKSFGEKVMDFLSSPQLVLMTLAGVVLVLGVPYMALQTLPSAENPFARFFEQEPAQTNPNPGMDFTVLDQMPDELSIGGTAILYQEEPVMPEPLAELEPPSGFGLLYPVTEAVETTRPTLTWTQFAPGPYEVVVWDAANLEVASVKNVPNLNWVVYGQLNRGARYRWQVTAANREIETASFVVMTDEAVREWQEVRTRLPNSHLALGLAAEQLGLLTAAEREYQELAIEFPDAEAPARLAANVLALRE